MKLAELLLWGLVGWTAVGLLGSLVSGARRGNWPKARRGFSAIAVAWTIYLLTLLLVSRTSPEKVVAVGAAQCFGDLCFAVDGVDRLTAFAGRGQRGDRLLRVHLRVRNQGHDGSERDGSVRAYLLDARGGRWWPLPGLTGVPLQSPISSGGEVVSEPVFSVPERVGAVRLVLTHGAWQPGALVIGNGDSLLHRPVLMDLGATSHLQ